MAKISTSTNIDWVQVQEQGSVPATPADGYGRIYCKSDGLYFVGDDGTEIGPLAAAISQNGYTTGARAYNDAAVTIGNNSLTAVALNSERYDTDTIHDVSTNNSRLTCKTAGKYLIVGQIRWTGNTTGTRLAEVYLNGGTAIARAYSAGQSANHDLVVTTIYSLSVNDYVEMRAYQNSGGNLDIVAAANYSPEFMMQRVG